MPADSLLRNWMKIHLPVLRQNHGHAIHYYEENEIEVGKPMDCQVVVNHVVKLTAEEKAEARQNAVRKYQEEELRKLQNRHRPSARKENQPQPSLFDLGL